MPGLVIRLMVAESRVESFKQTATGCPAFTTGFVITKTFILSSLMHPPRLARKTYSLLFSGFTVAFNSVILSIVLLGSFKERHWYVAPIGETVGKNFRATPSQIVVSLPTFMFKKLSTFMVI